MKLFLRLALIGLFFFALTATSPAQQKRPPTVKTPPRTATPLEPAPTFDTLLAAGTYKIYGEVRGVGQVIRSSSVNELLEPVMKLAAPPKEFKTLVKWLNTHAEGVMTSRMLVAGWPTANNLPELLVAIEFSSGEEAAKFEPQLNDFLPKVLPAPTPEDSPSPNENRTEPPKEKPKSSTPPTPNYYLKRVGSLLLITPTPLTLRSLRPAGSGLLTEDANFRAARDRFGAEPIFLFIDVKGIEREEQQRRKQAEDEARKREAEAAKQESEAAQRAAAEAPNQATPTVPPEVSGGVPGEPQPVETAPEPATAAPAVTTGQKQSIEPDPMMMAVYGLSSSFFGGQPKWPEAVGIALGLENDSFDVRALFVNSPGEKSDAVPLLPLLIPGPAIVPESPAILPANTELFVTMSLDLPQMYAGMAKPDRAAPSTVIGQTVNDTEVVSPFAPFEKKLGIKVKDDLLPLLGNEIVFSMPVNDLGVARAAPTPGPGNQGTTAQSQPAAPSPIIGIALRDKEGMRILLPRIVDALGFKGASALAKTEKRDDTEIVSYFNVVAYAFIGNFLVLSTDVATTRSVVDSYLRHETLGADGNFKNYTRWQPRQLQGQVYVSPALMESYKTWATEPNSLINDQTRELLMRLSVVAQPITYSLSNEGLGSLHELHIPKNLVLMAVAGISGEANQPPMVTNERTTLSALHWIASAEADYRSKNAAGSYASLEQLMAEKRISREILENYGYKVELTVTGNKFEVSAVPAEYGTTGRLSYFVDESKVVRAGDHGGGPATVADKPVQ